MAATQSSMELLQRRVSEISTCPICLDDLQNAKSLPCVHTFCLQCLKSYWKDTRAGQRVTCPVCRNPLNIPPNGLDSLPTNFIVQNLMEVSCSQSHVSGGIPCEEHPDKRLELYCFKCEVAICRKCQGIKHRRHRCHDVHKVAEEFAKSLEMASVPVRTRLEEFQGSLEKVANEDRQFLAVVNAVDVGAKQQGEKIKTIVDCQVAELLKELCMVKAEEQKELKSCRSVLELAISEMRSFVDSSLELRTKGSPCDITREAGALRDRATQLLATYVTPAQHKPGAPVLTFLPVNIDEFTQHGQSIVGRLQRHRGKGHPDDELKEILPQTKRERELELQLTCIIRRLKRRTDRVMEEQKKLQAEFQQAAEKMRSTEDQHNFEREQSQTVLQDVESTNQKVSDMNTEQQKERKILDEHRAVCDTASRQLIYNNLSDDYLKTMRSHDAAAARVTALVEKTRVALEEHNSIKVRMIKWWTRVDAESEVRNALCREHDLKDELKKIPTREATWKHTSSLPRNRMSMFQDEIHQSTQRQAQIHEFRSVKEWKAERAKELPDSSSQAVQNCLAMATKREQICQEEWKRSSDRVNTLQQEISQMAKRQHWMDEMKAACGEQTTVHELFQQTSSSNDLLGKQLQLNLKSEDGLLEKLQQAHERETLLIEELKTASEILNNIREKTDPTWSESEAVQESICQLEKETKLQEHLKEVCKREQWLEEYAEYMLQKEQKLRDEIKMLSGREEVFRIPLTQLKYRDSPMNEIEALIAYDGAQVRGMTSANGELFVLHYRNAEGEVSVYSTADFALSRRFSIYGLSRNGIQDMKARSDGDMVTLYLADSDNRCVHKVGAVDKTCSVVKWSLCKKPFGLAVLSNSNLLVTCRDNTLFSTTGTLVELDSRGVELRKIIPKEGASCVKHAVSQSCGSYVISYNSCVFSYKCTKISAINYDGVVTKSCETHWVSNEKDLINGTSQMAVDDDGFVFVADNASNQVNLLNPSLQFVRDIKTRYRPRWLHVDCAQRRLFVGHYSNAVSIIQLRKSPSEEFL